MKKHTISSRISIRICITLLLVAGILHPIIQLSFAEEQDDQESSTSSEIITKKKAEQGDVHAQFNLGEMYRKGEGVTQDYVEAVKWFRKAADQGFASAQTNLGFMYEKGQGVNQQYLEALKWYRKAADQGYASAQFNLGLLYAKGWGVTRDYVQAYMWFNLSSAGLSGDNQKKAVAARDAVTNKMTTQQIMEARRLAREWKPKKEK